MKTLQDRLKWSRERAGKSQQEVADFVGVKQSSYSELENGHTQQSKYTAQIAHFLGVNAYWLATGEGSHQSNTLPPDFYAQILSLSPENQEALLRIVRSMSGH